MGEKENKGKKGKKKGKGKKEEGKEKKIGEIVVKKQENILNLFPCIIKALMAPKKSAKKII